MLRTCPYCHGPLPAHGTCCRVPEDLDRFERVFERLGDSPDKHFLQANLWRYLVAFGRRSEDDSHPAEFQDCFRNIRPVAGNSF